MAWIAAIVQAVAGLGSAAAQSNASADAAGKQAGASALDKQNGGGYEPTADKTIDKQGDDFKPPAGAAGFQPSDDSYKDLTQFALKDAIGSADTPRIGDSTQENQPPPSSSPDMGGMSSKGGSSDQIAKDIGALGSLLTLFTNQPQQSPQLPRPGDAGGYTPTAYQARRKPPY